MRARWIYIIAVFVIAVSSLNASAVSGQPQAAVKQVSDLSIFRAEKFDAHYRAPNDAQVQNLLDEQEISLQDAQNGQARTPVQQFWQEWNRRNPDTSNPRKLENLLRQEAKREVKHSEATEPDTSVKSLVVPVEFAGTDTFDDCSGVPVTFTGPLHNQIGPPGPRDNNTIYYADASADLYNEMYFGVGPDAGIVIQHPNIGTVDLRGKTMANYYLEQSEGKFMPVGLVYPNWLQSVHSEGYFGADGCTGGSHNVRAPELVEEVVDLVNTDNPAFNWQAYDGNADGIVDNFTVIHAGMGQEAGGGAQGDYSIWSHASLVGWPTGLLACAAGTAGCPDRDIYVREYSMDPENIDLGVIAEEFGHAAFGLPDMYTTDAQMSLSNWAIMEAGSWNGILGGTEPAPFPLWFRYLVGWAEPVEMDYTGKSTDVVIGQLSQRPAGTKQGLRINLPNKQVEIPNPLSTGQAWWSDVGDLSTFTLQHAFDLAATTAPVFSFESYWSIEEDWDYGFVEISSDGGATWMNLADTGGFCVTSDPNGNNSAHDCGLTGEDSGSLSYDLAAYAGQQVILRLRYSTDMAAQWAGWWADDFALTDGATTLFTDDVEAGAGEWVTNNWKLVPLTNTYPRYYLAEWRNNSGFDEGLQYVYTTIYSDDDEWQVERTPYTVPGMLVYFRDASYALDYTLFDSIYDSPSYGPKHGIILVDSHFWPLEWEGMGTSEAHLRLGARSQPSNAAFTLQETTPFTVDRVGSTATGNIVETKTFAPQPAVSQFHDSLGYYPGLRYRPATGGLYFWQADASAVVPAEGNYTTRITWGDKTPAYDLYGYDMGDTVLGSGNPGDSGVQFGLHLAVVDKAEDGSWGRIVAWNGDQLSDLRMVGGQTVKAGNIITYNLKVTNTSAVSQYFALDDPLPLNTTYFAGRFFDVASNSLHWEGTLPPNGVFITTLTVRVNKGTPVGTVITNTAFTTDNALGDSAVVTTTVIK